MSEAAPAEAAPPVDSAAPPIDRLTLYAVTAVVFTTATLLHEGVGHGLTCALVGGHPVELSSTYLRCEDVPTLLAERWVSAAGTLVNLATAGLCALALRTRVGPVTRFALWLAATVNALQGFGYWMVPTAIGFGDWIAVLRGLPSATALRIGLVIAGTAGWLGTVALAVRGLEPFVAGLPVPQREARAKVLAALPYVAGCTLEILAGIFNPLGVKLVLISAAAASLGANAALPTMIPPWVAKRKLSPGEPGVGPPIGFPRSRAWIAAGVISAVVLLLLGGAVRLR